MLQARHTLPQPQAYHTVATAATYRDDPHGLHTSAQCPIPNMTMFINSIIHTGGKLISSPHHCSSSSQQHMIRLSKMGTHQSQQMRRQAVSPYPTQERREHPLEPLAGSLIQSAASLFTAHRLEQSPHTEHITPTDQRYELLLLLLLEITTIRGATVDRAHDCCCCCCC